MGFLMPPHLLYLEIQKYYKNQPSFNGLFSRNNSLKKIKFRADIINLDEYADVGTHSIALFCKKKIRLFISTVLVLNVFLKILNNFSKMKIYKLTFFEYKKMIQ